MNKTLLIFIALAFVLSCNKAKNQEQEIAQENRSKNMNYNDKDSIDHVKTEKSMAVIKAKIIKAGAGNKFINDTVEVLSVLKNQTQFDFPTQIEVAHYSVKEGIPENKECILYLTAFPFGATELNEQNEWMLLDGDGAYACECK